jgi:hypothetical protein
MEYVKHSVKVNVFEGRRGQFGDSHSFVKKETGKLISRIQSQKDTYVFLQFKSWAGGP